MGYFNETWQGQAVFIEQGQKRHWIENWQNGGYETEVLMYSSVIDKYHAIKIEVVCKVHSLTRAEAKPEIYTDGGVKMENALIEPKKSPNQEISTIRLSLDSFQVLTMKKPGRQVLIILAI